MYYIGHEGEIVEKFCERCGALIVYRSDGESQPLTCPDCWRVDGIEYLEARDGRYEVTWGDSLDEMFEQFSIFDHYPADGVHMSRCGNICEHCGCFHSLHSKVRTCHRYIPSELAVRASELIVLLGFDLAKFAFEEIYSGVAILEKL